LLTEKTRTEARCSQALFEWRENSIVINNELYKGFRESKATERIENTNDIVSGFIIPLSIPFLLVIDIYLHNIYYSSVYSI
jgi:hypothetical protein